MRFAGIKLSNYMDTPDFGIQAQQGLVSQSQERQAGSKATWMGDMAESKGAADYEIGKAQGQAVGAQGAASGQAAAFGGIMDGIGSIGGAAIKGGKIPGLGPSTATEPTMQGLNAAGTTVSPYSPTSGTFGGLQSYDFTYGLGG